MEKIFNILTQHLIDDYLIIILLAISWILIFSYFLFFKHIFPRVILEFPIFLGFKISESIYKYEVGKELGSCNISDKLPKIANRRVKILTKLINFSDKILTSIQEMQNIIVKILFSIEKVNEIIRTVTKRDIKGLEKYLASYQTFSSDKSIRQSGLLSLIGNPKTTKNEIRMLTHFIIECGPNELRNTALYHYNSLVNIDKKAYFEKKKKNNKMVSGGSEDVHKTIS